MEFSNENVINAVHNEPSLWDPNVNANEEEKEMAWKRISDAFGIKAGGCIYCIVSHLDINKVGS